MFEEGFPRPYPRSVANSILTCVRLLTVKIITTVIRSLDVELFGIPRSRLPVGAKHTPALIVCCDNRYDTDVYDKFVTRCYAIR